MRTYISFTFLYLFVSIVGLSAQAQSEGSDFELSGDVTLLSHYVEDGLSQTENSPSLQAAFWFNAGPQFRLGLWGSNVHYTGEDDVFNLRINADIKVDFDRTNFMKIKYANSLYFNDGERNGDIFGLHLHFSNLKISYDNRSNWEGIRRRANRYGLEYAHTLGAQWVWTNGVGYNQVKSKAIDGYFDLRTAIGNQWGALFVEGAVTGTTTPGQFDGNGDVFVILSIATEL